MWRIILYSIPAINKLEQKLLLLDNKGYVQEAYINSEMDANDYEKAIYEKTLEEQKQRKDEKNVDYSEVNDKAALEEI